MSDKIQPSAARRAGHGFFKALRAVFGPRRLRQAAESAKALRDEFEAGREEAEDPPPRAIDYRVVEDEDEDLTASRGP